MYGITLRSAGFTVHEADNGLDAVTLLEEGDGPLPDVLVLDLWLPTLDGLSVLDELGANSLTRDIPVVVVTGTEIDPARIRATQILRKPVDPQDLITAVR